MAPFIFLILSAIVFFSFSPKGRLVMTEAKWFKFSCEAIMKLSKFSASSSESILLSNSGIRSFIISLQSFSSMRPIEFSRSLHKESITYKSLRSFLVDAKRAKNVLFHKSLDSLLIDFASFSATPLNSIFAFSKALLTTSSESFLQSFLSLSTSILTFLSHNLFSTKARIPEPKPMTATIAMNAQL